MPIRFLLAFSGIALAAFGLGVSVGLRWRNKSQPKWRGSIQMQIRDIAVIDLTLALKDAEGALVTDTSGHTVAWAVETASGDSFGTVEANEQEPDNAFKQVFRAGTAGSSGQVKATVTPPEGAPFDIIAGPHDIVNSAAVGGEIAMTERAAS